MQPFFRPTPFNVKFPRQTAPSRVGWTGQGQPAFVTDSAFALEQFGISKINGTIVFSRELAKNSDPAAGQMFEQDLIASTAQFVDNAFLDPAIAETPDAPASITNAAAQIAASGNDAASFKADAAKLVQQMQVEGAVFQKPFWVMSYAQAVALSLLDPAFIQANGKLAGAPVLTTSAASVATSPTSGNIFLVDAAGVNFASLGVEIAVLKDGDVEMSSTPSNPPSAATVRLSFFQHNLIGLTLTYYVRWAPRHGGVSGTISGASYGLV